MTSQQIIHRLRQVLPGLAPLLRDDVPLQELALDSMDHVELLCAIHEEFGVRLTQADVTPGTSLGDIAKRLAETPAFA